MPYDDVAGFCLAVPWTSCASAAFRSASLHNWALAGVVRPDLVGREGPMSAYVAVADDSCIIEASVERPAERTRNATGEKTG
jgi:hypothetical protein